MAQSASSGQGPFTFPCIFCPPISPCFRPFCRLHCVQQLLYAFALFSRPAACTCVSLDAVRTLSSFCKTSMSASFRLASGSFGTMLKALSHSRYISWAVSFTFGCVTASSFTFLICRPVLAQMIPGRGRQWALLCLDDCRGSLAASFYGKTVCTAAAGRFCSGPGLRLGQYSDFLFDF